MNNKYEQCEHRLFCGTCVKTGKQCPHVETSPSPSDVSDRKPVRDWTLELETFTNIPNCCITCPNHILNGGSGVCNCALPYMSEYSSSPVVKE